MIIDYHIDKRIYLRINKQNENKNSDESLSYVSYIISKLQNNNKLLKYWIKWMCKNRMQYTYNINNKLESEAESILKCWENIIAGAMMNVLNILR